MIQKLCIYDTVHIGWKLIIKPYDEQNEMLMLKA